MSIVICNCSEQSGSERKHTGVLEPVLNSTSETVCLIGEDRKLPPQ
ncbi:MAG: hypothetical protein NC246_10470 [Muribaculaceae bacterium]|nr:hypothetical protein [Muribaculaceae bacterium]